MIVTTNQSLIPAGDLVMRPKRSGLGLHYGTGLANGLMVGTYMRHRWMGLIAVVLALACAPGCRRPPDNSQDRADVEQVFNKYLQTINTLDVALASQVWLHS